MTNDWLRPQGLREALGGIVGQAEGAGSYAVVIRSADPDDFSDEDRDIFRLLMNALVPALRVHARLARVARRERALFEALDRAGLAAFVLRVDAGLAAHNHLADDLRRAGRAIRAAGAGQVAAAHPSANDALRRAIALACRFSQAITLALPQPGTDDPPLLGLVTPIEGSALASVGPPLAERALLLVRHPTRPQPRAAALRQIFGLTAAEAALTEALAEGRDLREIAEVRRVNYATLRAQLRSVMGKTATRRQGELIALAHRTAAIDPSGDTHQTTWPRNGGQ